MNIEERITAYIQRGVHSERPVIDRCEKYMSISTEIWSPTIYDLEAFEANWGLVFCGELDGEYVFRSNL